MVRRIRPLRAMLEDLRAAPHSADMAEGESPAQSVDRNTVALTLIDRPLRLYVVGDNLLPASLNIQFASPT